MIWQYLIVYIIIASASSFTLYRLYQFFAARRNKCSNCHGCALKEIKPSGKLTPGV